MELYAAELARPARSSNARAIGMFRSRSGVAGSADQRERDLSARVTSLAKKGL